jgi:hypothetical protein
VTDAREALGALLAIQDGFERGPKREGAFALWLVARVAVDIGSATTPESERAERRRVALLDRRIAPLAVPRPLARGLTAALSHLQDASPAGARIALSQLVAPARDALGPEAGEAIAVLTRHLHDAQLGTAP